MAISEKAQQFTQNNIDRGRAIPGQSLTNSPNEKYNWEKPSEISNSREAMMMVFETLTVPETTTNLLLSLTNGVGVIDIASIILYEGFREGKWNPDLMTLLMEPTMYMIIALAEKADIEYVLDSADEDEPQEISGVQAIQDIENKISQLDIVRKKASERINPQSVPQEVRKIIEQTELSPSLLEKVEQEKPTSLLSRGK
jgi:hypothetical protein|tara:strand:+ start:143 stop:739 length:597 start_codon:yes stop_codon:yes gene_type:complete